MVVQATEANEVLNSAVEESAVPAAEVEPVDEVAAPEEAEATELLPAEDAPALATFAPQHNTTLVTVTLGDMASVQAQGATAVRVRAAVIYNGEEKRSVQQEVALADIDPATGSFDVDFGTFGKLFATVDLLKDGEVLQSLPQTQVNVTADTYNIGALTATMPVTLFSLSLWGDGNIRTDGPSMIMLMRAAAYNWDELPGPTDSLYGVYGIPYFTDEELRAQQDDQFGHFINDQAAVIADYVHDLYEISPDSQFVFYFGDNFSFVAQTCIYANGIPEDHYSMNVLSDGTGSYSASFGQHYAGTDPAADHERYVQEWVAAKQHAYETGVVDEGFDGPAYDNIQRHVWAMIDSEPNAHWWLTRPSLLNSAGDGNTFGSAVAASPKVRSFNVGNALKALQAAGDDAIAEFKALYDFNDGYFSAAEEQGKDAMVFLGTRVDREANFSEYARFVMEYYGDDYVYYYKGHPATPTDLHPNKAAQLKGLGITDVDATIAAELILFFNPEIYLSGYASSTYSSVPKGMGKGMFNMTKAAGLANEMYCNMDYWSTPVSDATPEAARALCTEGHDNFLVEFSDEIIAEKGYDIAIWDATDSLIIYYRLEEDGSYTEVGRSGSGIKGDMSLPEGTYIIQSNLRDDLVLDNPHSSTVAGSNIHVWAYNGGANQQWELTYDREGYATLVNKASGKALDVTAGSSRPGTNIEQWDTIGSTAQKWNVKRNTDGTYTLISCVGNDVAADVAGANAANGTNVLLWNKTNAANQKWRFLSLKPDVSAEGMAEIEEGYYTLAPKLAPSMRLDVEGWSMVNGANLLSWHETGGVNQVFHIKKLESGFYSLTNAFTGKALDVDHGAPISGTNVLQWQANGGTNQEWAITSLIDGTYGLQNVGTALMLDLYGANTSAGANVAGYRANGRNSQRWLLHKVDDPCAATREKTSGQEPVVEAGTYTIASSVRANAVLDVAGANMNGGANVLLWDNHGGANQKWEISYDEDGFASIVNVNSGKALSYEGIGNLVNVAQHTRIGAANEKWALVANDDGTVTLVPALASGFALDADHGRATNGTNIQLYQANGGAAQRFRLTAA